MSRRPAEPIGTFLAQVAVLARTTEGSDGFAARQYLRAMQDRRHVLDDTPAKTALLAALAPALRNAAQTLVFTQSIAAAERVESTLRPLSIEARAIHSAHSPGDRRERLRRFALGEVTVLAGAGAREATSCSPGINETLISGEHDRDHGLWAAPSPRRVRA
jgi:superfamily II DNA or RNA helicase